MIGYVPQSYRCTSNCTFTTYFKDKGVSYAKVSTRFLGKTSILCFYCKTDFQNDHLALQAAQIIDTILQEFQLFV
jgi:hypothetical protein